LLPIVAFALVEQIYGTVGGVIAGVVFGGGEILWEYNRLGKVQGITWLSNALVLVLGLASIWENNGVFFKLQPAVFMVVFAVIFLGSSALGKPFMLEAAKKQNPNLPEQIIPFFRGLNVRLGFLFIALAGLSVYSALYWSTAAWASLKAVGLPAILLVYMVCEMAWMRLRRRN
jgi:intracellular septation protein